MKKSYLRRRHYALALALFGAVGLFAAVDGPASDPATPAPQATLEKIAAANDDAARNAAERFRARAEAEREAEAAKITDRH